MEKPSQCQTCGGTGLVKRADPPSFGDCKHGPGVVVCYRCEGTLRLGNYCECASCRGTGAATPVDAAPVDAASKTS